MSFSKLKTKGIGKLIASGLLILFVAFYASYFLLFVIRTFNERKIGIDANDYYFMTHSIEYYSNLPENITERMINQDDLHGFQITPEKITKKGIIITFGDETNNYNRERALECVKQGYEVISFYFFGRLYQTDYLSEVPIEYFSKILNYAKENCQSTETITVIASSKGAEYALNLQNYYPQINNLVLFSPSSHNFQGLTENDVSSWVYNNENLPYISFKNQSIMARLDNFMSEFFHCNFSYKSKYSSSLKNADNAEEARIKTDNFKGNMLLFAGTADKYWDSAKMAQTIYDNHKDNTEIYLYEGVGHDFIKGNSLKGYKLGGTIDKNRNAYKESTEIMMKSINEWHK